ncbi:MAG: hypothetical protein P4L33_02690 [Capsulimonadaceae bacterium]|nr:hypothetical protein [Capsulimonadaceae bacterium]
MVGLLFICALISLIWGKKTAQGCFFQTIGGVLGIALGIVAFVVWIYNGSPTSISLGSHATSVPSTHNVPEMDWHDKMQSFQHNNGGDWAIVANVPNGPVAGPHDRINLTLFKGIQPGWTLQQVNQYLHEEGKPEAWDTYTWYDSPESPDTSPCINVTFQENHAFMKSAHNLGDDASTPNTTPTSAAAQTPTAQSAPAPFDPVNEWHVEPVGGKAPQYGQFEKWNADGIIGHSIGFDGPFQFHGYSWSQPATRTILLHDQAGNSEKLTVVDKYDMRDKRTGTIYRRVS